MEIQHKTFLQLHKNVEKAKARQAKYYNQNAKQIEFQVGDPVYLKKHVPKGKLDKKWLPFFRIIEKRDNGVSFVIRNQLTGDTRKTHANDIRLANVDQWEVPEMTRPVRGAQLVERPESSENSLSSSSSEEQGQGQNQGQPLADRFRNERSTSSEEGNIPLAELKRRVWQRGERLRDAGNEGSGVDSEFKESIHTSPQASTDHSMDESMSVDEVTRSRSKR